MADPAGPHRFVELSQGAGQPMVSTAPAPVAPMPQGLFGDGAASPFAAAAAAPGGSKGINLQKAVPLRAPAPQESQPGPPKPCPTSAWVDRMVEKLRPGCSTLSVLSG